MLIVFESAIYDFHGLQIFVNNIVIVKYKKTSGLVVSGAVIVANVSSESRL